MPRSVVFAPTFLGYKLERGAVGSLGPGACEGLRVSLRRKRRRDYSKPAKKTGRYVWNERKQRFDWKPVRRFAYERTGERDPIIAVVTGGYTVYCGAGWEHTVFIEQRDWIYPEDELWEAAFRAWKEHDPHSAEDVADELVDRQLEDWSDPCDPGDED